MTEALMYKTQTELEMERDLDYQYINDRLGKMYHEEQDKTLLDRLLELERELTRRMGA